LIAYLTCLPFGLGAYLGWLMPPVMVVLAFLVRRRGEEAATRGASLAVLAPACASQAANWPGRE
jgi:hypothetical protein